MQTKIRMLQNRVLVQPSKELNRSIKGIVLPDSLAKNLGRGVIKAIEESKLRVGDRVLYDARQQTEITLDGEDYVMVHENQIFGIILEEPSPQKMTKPKKKPKVPEFNYP